MLGVNQSFPGAGPRIVRAPMMGKDTYCRRGSGWGGYHKPARHSTCGRKLRLAHGE